MKPHKCAISFTEGRAQCAQDACPNQSLIQTLNFHLHNLDVKREKIRELQLEIDALRKQIRNTMAALTGERH